MPDQYSDKCSQHSDRYRQQHWNGDYPAFIETECRQEDRSQGSQDGHARHSDSPADVSWLDRSRVAGAIRRRQHEQSRAARLYRSPVRLRFAGRQQRIGLCGLFQCAGTPRPIVVGAARDIDKRRSRLLAHDDNGSVIFEDAGAEDLEGASRQIIAKLQEGGYPTPDVVGHRIVHGGPEVLDHCLIDDSVMRKLEDATAFAPLHGRPALSIVKIAQAAYRVPHVACLDTVFHRSMPAMARRFPLPSEFAARGLYRYGFHGLSCESIVRQLADRVPSRLIVAHLGSGASVTAIKEGRSVDNSMGLTPTGGVMMATRCGDLDPGLLVYLVRLGYEAQRLEELLDKESDLPVFPDWPAISKL